MVDHDKIINNYKPVDINLLVKAKWNYKIDDHERTEKLKNNIKLNGQIENIIVRNFGKGKFEIVNGNHRLDAMKELKIKKVMVFDCGDISLTKAKRIAIETNETIFDSDPFKLAETIVAVMKDIPIDELILTMPYTEEDLMGFGKLLDFDWDQFAGSDDGNGLGEEDEEGKMIEITVSERAFNMWLQWKAKLKEHKGIDSEDHCFEVAVSHALTIPVDKLI
jgi:hypothetical protein